MFPPGAFDGGFQSGLGLRQIFIFPLRIRADFDHGRLVLAESPLVMSVVEDDGGVMVEDVMRALGLIQAGIRPGSGRSGRDYSAAVEPAGKNRPSIK